MSVSPNSGTKGSQTKFSISIFVETLIKIFLINSYKVRLESIHSWLSQDGMRLDMLSNFGQDTASMLEMTHHHHHMQHLAMPPPSPYYPTGSVLLQQQQQPTIVSTQSYESSSSSSSSSSPTPSSTTAVEYSFGVHLNQGRFFQQQHTTASAIEARQFNTTPKRGAKTLTNNFFLLNGDVSFHVALSYHLDRAKYLDDPTIWIFFMISSLHYI